MKLPRLLRKMLLTACGFLLLTVLAGKAAAAPPGERCDKEKARTPYAAGMEQYGRRQWKAAIPEIEAAAGLCPASKGAWYVTVQFLGQFPYLPFYYMGKCHYNLKDLPEALRHFYLSSCVGEPERDDDATEDLASLSRQCRRGLESKQPPQQHPYFPAGLAAAEQQDWEKAAEKMWDSLQVWEEDGRITLTSRWPVPYLPRFRLAEALFQLGCYREGCEQLDRSLLKNLRTPEVAMERRRLEQLKPECERRKREAENESCQRWKCWLQKRGLEG